MTDANAEPSANSPAPPSRFARRGFELAAIALAGATALFLVWQASGSFFLVFAGLLFAVFLDACTRGLGSFWSASRGWRLATVCVALIVLMVAGVSFGGYTIARQADDIFAVVQEQLRSLRGEVRTAPQGQSQPFPAAPGGQQSAPAQGSDPQAGSPPQGANEGVGSVLRSFFPNANALLRTATTTLGGVAGVLGNLVVMLFLGLYVAISPEVYRGGALLLLPRDKRERVGAVIDQSAETLRWWIVGQLVSMAIIAGLTYLALLLVGMPGPIILALITGLFAFIPYIGFFVAGAIIVLVGLSQGTTMALWGLGVYLLVQMIESYVLAPIVQRWSVNLSPALIIGGLAVLGALFGIWGFILAAPLIAVLRVLIMRLWVEDALGDPEGASKALESS
jgi:predicted PurR-regulated permease PerM